MTFMVLKYIKERYATPSEAGDILLMNLKPYFSNILLIMSYLHSLGNRLAPLASCARF